MHGMVAAERPDSRRQRRPKPDSETDDGRLCAGTLSEFYKSKKYRCMVKAISNLRYDAQQFKNRGLRSLVTEMAQIVRERKWRSMRFLLMRREVSRQRVPTRF
ncbi:MAG: hypothetical protein CFK49_07920 [Armatimonadetes bacterium JP3_11]|nr:MAG: hypothetical protein CFK48_02460 [Armatimonadetes bacterium CP1_7O]OYT74537.1 MAG: hypothetical protein CFK49_07920 [Armatimonadetes bacterium JP3_11]